MSDAAAIILAAGQSSRYRAQDASIPSKVVALLDGKPLVRHVAEAALASSARPVIVITGHAREETTFALQGLGVACVHNADYASGMSGSLRTGVQALPPETRGVIIMLADMPRVSAAFLNKLMDAFHQHPTVDAIVPVYNGQRGNPVLIARSLFAAVDQLQGDEGARRILNDPALNIAVVPGEEDNTFDIDTPDALKLAMRHSP